MLQDPLQFTESALIVPPQLAPLLSMLDGSRSKSTVLQIAENHYGLRLEMETLDHLLEALDEVYLLENDRANKRHDEVIAEYRDGPYRPSSLAGLSYPKDPAVLHKLLQDYLEEADSDPLPKNRIVRGLLSPHIDYPRGGSVYAAVWKRAAEVIQDVELVIMLGTDHYGGSGNPITLTRQNYATPYGVLPTEQSVVDALVSALGEDLCFRGELYHRNEHALELVAVWLQHMRGKKPVPVVPILCGSFGEYLYEDRPISESTLIDTFVSTIKNATAGKKTLVLISGDLSHVGPAFGGDPLNNDGKFSIEEDDHVLLEHLMRGDGEGFFQTIQHTKDANNVCGTTPLYLAMRILGKSRGEVSNYAQCSADDKDTSIVSISGMVFE